MPGAIEIIGFNFETIDGSLRDGAAAQVSRSFGVGFGKKLQISLCGSVLPLTCTTREDISRSTGPRWPTPGMAVNFIYCRSFDGKRKANSVAWFVSQAPRMVASCQLE